MSKKNKLNTPEGRTQFAEESAEAAAAENPGGGLALALFGGTANAGLEKLMEKAERRNLPQMVKPGEVPEGGVVSGEIVKVVDSPVSTVKGKLLWLRHLETGHEFLFPCTGVVRNALAPGVEADSKELQKALESEIGKVFLARRLPSKTSGKYKKEMFMFDVYTFKP